jgi:hypothetical protein
LLFNHEKSINLVRQLTFPKNKAYRALSTEHAYQPLAMAEDGKDGHQHDEEAMHIENPGLVLGSMQDPNDPLVSFS